MLTTSALRTQTRELLIVLRLNIYSFWYKIYYIFARMTEIVNVWYIFLPEDTVDIDKLCNT